jgi:hypothetical protein
MARFNVTAPDGSIIPVDAPEGATEQDAIAFAASIYKPAATPKASVVSQIPTEPGANLTPTVYEPRSMFQRAMGNIETIPALAGGLVGGAIAPIAGLIGSLTSGKYGTQEGIQAGEAAAQETQKQFYQPRTPEAQRNVTAVGDVLAPLVGVPIPTLNALGQSTPAAIRAVRDIGRSEANLVGGAIAAPLETRAARIQQSRVTQSYADAPIIDAAKAAQRQGFAVDPAVTNPTLENRVKGAVVGSAFDDAASKYNAAQTTKIVRKDLGISATENLTDAMVNRALDDASKPYAPIRAMPVLQVSDNVLASIQELNKPATLGGKLQAKVVTTLIDDVVQELQDGRSGAQIIDDIRQMRRQAQSVYKSRDSGNNPPPAEVAQADARMGIANALEKMIDENAPNAKVLKEFQQARIRMAQIYDHERAINFSNGTVDPQIYAKLLDEKKGSMTGVGADIGTTAAMFPNLMNTQTPIAQLAPKVTRSGILGAAGALVGGGVAGYPGAIGGASVGGASGFVGSRLAARGMVNPDYQAARAIPKDYRPEPNMLRPAEPNYGPNQLAPYDYSQQTFTPPNFVMRPNQYGARVTPGVADIPNALPAPAAGGPMAGFRAEDVRAGAMSRTLGQQAETQAAQAAATARQPTRGGSPLVFNERGQLIPADQTLRGATPNIQIIESTGKNLNSAAELLASGKTPALMTAEQKIAWEKTKVDLAEVLPGMKTLSNKAIANKIQDRAWVQDAITKAQDKANAFADIAARAKDAQTLQIAKANRERMIDLVTDLENALRNPRPDTSSKQQGPKTKAAFRESLFSNPPNVPMQPPRSNLFSNK